MVPLVSQGWKRVLPYSKTKTEVSFTVDLLEADAAFIGVTITAVVIPFKGNIGRHRRTPPPNEKVPCLIIDKCSVWLSLMELQRAQQSVSEILSKE